MPTKDKSHTILPPWMAVIIVIAIIAICLMCYYFWGSQNESREAYIDRRLRELHLNLEIKNKLKTKLDKLVRRVYLWTINILCGLVILANITAFLLFKPEGSILIVLWDLLSKDSTILTYVAVATWFLKKPFDIYTLKDIIYKKVEARYYANYPTLKPSIEMIHVEIQQLTLEKQQLMVYKKGI